MLPLTYSVAEAWARGQALSVHGWVYSLSNGLVTDLNCSVQSQADLDGPRDRGSKTVLLGQSP